MPLASWFKQWSVVSGQSIAADHSSLTTAVQTQCVFLLEALSGLILEFLIWGSFVTWVAKLQFPFFHLTEGSGQAVQYQPEGNSEARLHPWHSSTIWWQAPPLKEQPFLVIKTHSNPCFTVVQSIGITPFPSTKTSAFLSTHFALVNKILRRTAILILAFCSYHSTRLNN